MNTTDDAVIAATRHWVVTAVIGLNLCPFARAVHVDNRIRYVVTDVTTPRALLEVLAVELARLDAADARDIETTLLIHPRVLTDFLEYNAFLERADALVEQSGFSGILQVASFHPRYQFAGTAPDDISNCSNRSPYPMLHLLREASIARAVDGHPDPARIYQTNIETLRRLGHEGWAALGVSAPDD